MNIMENRYNFIIWGAFEHFRGRQIPINLTNELAKSHKVLYIEHPFTFFKFFIYGEKKEYLDYLKYRIKHPSRIKKAGKNIWVQTAVKVNFLPFSYPPFIRRLNISLNKHIINKFIMKHFNRNTIFIAFTPLPYELTNKIDTKLNIYYCIDEYIDSEYLQNSPKLRTEIQKLENNFLKSSDLIFFTSSYLAYKKSYLAKESYVLENAVNENFFKTHTKKLKNLNNLKRPIIGYCGGLNFRLGFNYLEKIASDFSTGSIVLIGGGTPTKKLMEHKNVHFFGLEPYEKIPSYINNFDVCIIPFLMNERAKSAFPLKLYEYFALGKPVVTTSNPSIVNSTTVDQNLLYYADSPDEFSAQVKKALDENSDELRQKRIQLAKNNTWSARAKQFIDIINEKRNKLNDAKNN